MKSVRRSPRPFRDEAVEPAPPWLKRCLKIRRRRMMSIRPLARAIRGLRLAACRPSWEWFLSMVILVG